MTTQLTQDEIRAVFLSNGFTVKEGQTDLKDYVYAAARELIAAHEAKQAVDTENIPVNADNLRTVLSALNGPPHYIRELQALNKPPFNSPIAALTDQFNAWAEKVNAAIEAQGNEAGVES